MVTISNRSEKQKIHLKHKAQTKNKNRSLIQSHWLRNARARGFERGAVIDSTFRIFLLKQKTKPKNSTTAPIRRSRETKNKNIDAIS